MEHLMQQLITQGLVQLANQIAGRVSEAAAESQDVLKLVCWGELN